MQTPARFRIVRVGFCFLSALLSAGTILLAQNSAGDSKRLLGYYPEWSKYNNPPYLCSADQIPYSQLTDNAASTNSKTHYIVKQPGFGGVFVWELSADYDGKSQDLMTAMYKAWLASQ